MKIFLCFLLFYVCSCLDDNGKSKNNYRTEIVHDDENYGRQQNGPIMRPCSLHDVNCIRRYFARNSRCSPAVGRAPDPYRMGTLPMNVPNANITFTMNDIQISGFNDWKIKEFYINKATDRLVLEVEFDTLVVYSDATMISFHRKGKEPIELTDYSLIEYRSLSLTMIVPHVRDIQLSRAHVYTYISDVAPRYRQGPAFMASNNSLVIAANKQRLENIGLSLQEAFVTQGPVFMAVFVQTTICDFQQPQIYV